MYWFEAWGSPVLGMGHGDLSILVDTELKLLELPRSGLCSLGEVSFGGVS